MLQHLLIAVLALAPPRATCPDTADVAAFVSHFISSRPPVERVRSGAFVLVCGDRQVYATGIGTARDGKPVDPDRTLFRAASNSKLIVATAAMQLAMSGRWKLSDDVNAFLPEHAKLADGFGRQVTIADLLTHTAGFEDKFAGAIALPSGDTSLADFFARHRPTRVRPAGLEVSYSNVGMALTGYAVERASGESFADYATKHIFTPLGMTHSTFAQPIPDDWRANPANPAPRATRAIMFVPYPAASLVTTPSDMGRFIAAHLSGGATGVGRILSPSVASEMNATHWRAQPNVPGVAYGFFEGEMNGRSTLFHTGDSGDHSVVFMFRDEGVGFYFVYSGTDQQTVIREKLAHAFADRFFPAVNAVAATAARPRSAELKELAGVYRGVAYSHTNYEKLKAMLYQVRVRDGDDGTLLISPPGAGAPLRLRPRGPLVFAADSGEVVAFRGDSGHGVASFTLSGSIWDPQSFDRIGFLEDGRLHLAAFGAIAFAILVRILSAPVGAVVRRVRRTPKPAMSRAETNWWRLSGVLSALAMLTPIIGIGVAFLSFRPAAIAVPRAAFVVGMWLTLVSLAGLALLPGAVAAWRERFWTSARRVVFAGVAVAFALAVPLLAYWRVIPF